LPAVIRLPFEFTVRLPEPTSILLRLREDRVETPVTPRVPPIEVFPAESAARVEAPETPRVPPIEVFPERVEAPVTPSVPRACKLFTVATPARERFPRETMLPRESIVVFPALRSRELRERPAMEDVPATERFPEEDRFWPTVIEPRTCTFSFTVVAVDPAVALPAENRLPNADMSF
jgi:hypothetical protein